METARRALEVAASGGHNMLMIGHITQLIMAGIRPCFFLYSPPTARLGQGILLWAAYVRGRTEHGAIYFDMQDAKNLPKRDHDAESRHE
ncbi:MAG TPA: ATP-binding protein [Acidocella sp.]